MTSDANTIRDALQPDLPEAHAALDRLEAQLAEYLQMVFADMASENKAHRSYNAQGIRMRCERAEARAVAAEADLARANSELAFLQDRGDHVIYRDEWEAFDKWQRTDEDERLRAQLEAVDAALPPWESPSDSETGCVGRVATIVNLVADRDALRDELAALKQRLGVSEWTREVAESRVAALEEALRPFAALPPNQSLQDWTVLQLQNSWIRDARAALADKEGT